MNLPLELRREAGRVAFCEGRSLGAWIREAVAERVRAARERGLLDAPGQLTIRLGCAVAAIGLGLALGAAMCGQNELRRPARAARRRDEWALAAEVGA